jgi:ferredoxin--NADP+ reductase
MFTIAETVEADTLWCMSTGTGIGPFLSMLRTEDPWDKFANVVLVHAVRFGRDLSFREEIAGIARAHEGRFRYLPVVSREPLPDALPGRITSLIEDGRLEARAGVPLTVESAHAMLCGNPEMVDDVQKVLATRGMRRHRRKEPGHVTLETYW